MTRMNRRLTSVVTSLLLAAVSAAKPQGQPQKPSALVAGKLVAVAPMPANLDKWILEDLRAWGKYKLTGDPEGASLVIEALVPERSTEYEIRGGIPQPRRGGVATPAPGT